MTIAKVMPEVGRDKFRGENVFYGEKYAVKRMAAIEIFFPGAKIFREHLPPCPALGLGSC